MVPLYTLGQDNWNEMQYDFWSNDAITITIGLFI